MTAPDLVPAVTLHQLVVLAAILLVVMVIAVGMAVADHVATEWQAQRYEDGQSPLEGRVTGPAVLPRIPTQRQPTHDEIGDPS